MKYTILFLLLLLVTACVEDPADPNNPNNNMPVIINTTNSYNYTIHAEEYSHELTDFLNFNSDSLNNNKTFIKTGIVVDVPDRAEIKFEEFSGDLSMIIKAA